MTVCDFLAAASWWQWLFILLIIVAIASVFKKLTFVRIDKRTESHTHQHTHQHIHNPEK